MGPDVLDRQSLWYIRQTKPDIRPDTGYKKGRISGRPDIRCNPSYCPNPDTGLCTSSEDNFNAFFFVFILCVRRPL